MQKPKRVMVAIGFFPHAPELFNYAAGIATGLGAEMVVANIINQRDVDAVSSVSAMGYDVDGEHYVSGVEAERKQHLQSIIDQSGYGQETIRMVVRVGNPVDELLAIAQEEAVDLIVMGIKGRSNLEHVFVGSVADKVFRRSPVPVLSFRDEDSVRRLHRRMRK